MKLSLAIARWLSNYFFALYRPVYFLYKQVMDREEARIMKSCIKKGDTVLDIGANIGFHARLLSSLVGIEGKVYSFEPSPRSYKRLLQHTRRLPQVVAIQAAVSNQNGTARVYLSKELSVDDRTYTTQTHSPSAEVQALRLDDYMPDDLQVTFVKMDIQGSEVDALNGMRRILTSSDRLVVLCECCPYALTEAGTSVASLLVTLESAGLIVKVLHGNRLSETSHLTEIQYQWNDPYFFRNLVACHPAQYQFISGLFPTRTK